MEFALANKLKDAGFPQKQFEFHNGFSGEWPSDVKPCDYPYNPTLEELIEACGDKFLGLLQHDDGSGWTALKPGDVLFTRIGENEHLSLGKTPTEAVARLWLALNPRQSDAAQAA